MRYLEATNDLYKEAALTPDVGLCCTTNPILQFPRLSIPKIMQEMNNGCRSTVSAQDLIHNPKVLYVGVGGGMELLQFSYFSRQKGGVTGVDVVDDMLEALRKNFKISLTPFAIIPRLLWAMQAMKYIPVKVHVIIMVAAIAKIA